MTVSKIASHAAAALIAAASIGSSQAAEDSSAPLTITRAGSNASAKGQVPNNFTGNVRVDLLHAAQEPWHTSAAYVTFEPGARTVWHTHPVGQALVVTAGVGRIQRAGSATETIRPGDVVWIPAGVKHWHGASPTTGMTHLAITETANGKNVDWLEPVSNEDYVK